MVFFKKTFQRKVFFSLTSNARRAGREPLESQPKTFLKKSFFKFDIWSLYCILWAWRQIRVMKWNRFLKTWASNCLAVVVRFPQKTNYASHAAQMQIISVMKCRGKNTASQSCAKRVKTLCSGLDICADSC